MNDTLKKITAAAMAPEAAPSANPALPQANATRTEPLNAEAKPLKRQTRKEKIAEDLTYIANHTALCLATDFANPIVNTATGGLIKSLGGCGHVHKAGEPHHHHGHEHGTCNHKKPTFSQRAQKLLERVKNGRYWPELKTEIKGAFSKETLKRWVKGEIYGDLAAVPLTAATQAVLPGLMSNVEHAANPVADKLFRFGAEMEAKSWAKKNHIAVNSAEYKQRIEEKVGHEKKHLPQAIIWTGWALAGNVAYQMVSNRNSKDKMTLAAATVSALGGQTITAGALLLTRSMLPAQMQKIDHFTSNSVALPMVKIVGKALGVGDEDFASADKKSKERNTGKWAQRAAQAIPSALARD